MAGVVVLTVLALVLALSSSHQVQAVSCRDSRGQEVDWWILYKLPKNKKSEESGGGEQGKWWKHHNKHNKHNKYKHHHHRSKFDKNVEEGTAYAYLTSSMPDKEWTMSSLSISSPSSLPGRTLEPLYSQSGGEMFSLLYNDEHPHGPTSFDKGHTKGLVVGDRNNSIWLIHSVPHYPPFPNETYSYPHTGHLYGQTALCLSLGSDQLASVGRQLNYNTPFIYQTTIPAWLSAYPDMVRAAQGKHIRRPPFFNTELVTTAQGEVFTTFAKYEKFGKDLYADLVAPMLRVPLLVETWPNGKGKMPSRCSGPFIVENIDEMEFPELDDDDFKTTHDHAKWAISIDRKKPFVCIGDINRMETQRKRGGGTACFSNPTVWRTFKKSIKTIEAC